SIFDPASDGMQIDDGATGVPRFADIIWGIGVYRFNDTVRVYYACWRDSNFSGPEVLNIIRSVALDSSGDFIPATDQQEFILPTEGIPQPFMKAPSDIEFSSTGRMLVAERT